MDVKRNSGPAFKGELKRIVRFVPAPRAIDLSMCTLGFRRHAVAHYRRLADEVKTYLQRYVDGVNAFIRNGEGQQLHLEFKLAGIAPEIWQAGDALAF